MDESIEIPDFESLLQRNRGRWAAIAHSYSSTEAEDLLQEILLQIWKGLRNFRGESNIDTWCYRVALNTSLMWNRSRGRRSKNLPQVPIEDSQLGVTENQQDPVSLLRRFMQTLGETDRAIVLMYLDDLSGSEIAEVVGLSESAVRVRIHRIKKRLSSWEASEL